MSKYSLELKLEVVQTYLSNSYTISELTNKYNLKSGTQIKDWANKYEQYGVAGLRRKISKTKYSGEFKLRVIKYRQLNGTSLKDTANHFGITHGSTIANWTKKYEEEGFEGLNRPIGRSRKMSDKKNKSYSSKLNETEREELIRLREENELLKASNEYEKKLRALVLEKELRTKRRHK